MFSIDATFYLIILVTKTKIPTTQVSSQRKNSEIKSFILPPQKFRHREKISKIKSFVTRPKFSPTQVPSQREKQRNRKFHHKAKIPTNTCFITERKIADSRFCSFISYQISSKLDRLGAGQNICNLTNSVCDHYLDFCKIVLVTGIR